MTNICIAQTDEDISRCFGVMAQLRPHLTPDEFIQRVRQQQAEGYFLAFVADAGAVKSVAGFRLQKMLAHGKILYVDDLVTDEAARSKGYGEMLFDWLMEYAAKENCDKLQLDSSVHRFAAHRFYLRKRMDIVSHHFSVNVTGR